MQQYSCIANNSISDLVGIWSDLGRIILQKPVRGGGGASPLFTLYSLFFFSLLLSVSSLSLSVSISLYIYLLLSIPPLVPSLPSPCLISIVSSLFLTLSLLYRVSFFLSSSLSCFIYISVSSSFLYILSLSQLYLLLSSFTLSLLPHLMWVSINCLCYPTCGFLFQTWFETV